MTVFNRRRFLWTHGGGLGGIALAHMLGVDALPGQTSKPRPEWNGGLHHPAKAKRVIQLFMSGAASQCDSFDYKPRLIRSAGQKWDPGEKVELFQSNPGVVTPSPWEWKQYGQCGKWMSGLFPNTATCVDDIAFVHSMVAKSNVHGPATFMQATGFVLPGFPSMGAWISYGLGSLNQNLPTFVVLPDVRGVPPNGPANWSSGFLAASHQATTIRVGSPDPIQDLFPPKTASFITKESDREGLELLRSVNQEHLREREGDSRLDARIASYEMAARLQLTAPEVLDVSSEPESVKKLYGLDQEITSEMGRRCLVARRLLERGVRFIQIWSGADNGFPRRNWDSHENVAKDHGDMASALDKPMAGLILDLKARGRSKTRSCTGPPSSAACLAARVARGVTTTPSDSRVGWREAASRAALHMAPPMSGHTRRWTTSMQRCCTFSALTTPGLRIATTAWTAGSPTFTVR